MPDALDLDDVCITPKLIDDSIIANADSVSALGTRQFLRAVWQWIVSELGRRDNDACHISANLSLLMRASRD